MKLTSLLLCAPLAVGCADNTSADSSSLTAAVGACGDVETHVFGVYAPSGGTQETIFIGRPGKHALVLSAHESTTWNVSVGPGVELLHVYAVGYHKQHVNVPAGVHLFSDSFDGNGVYACGYEDGAANGCDTSQLLELASKRVHHEVTTFHGCYGANSWTIGADMAATSDCDTTPGFTQYDWAGGCNPNNNGSACGGSGSGSGSDNGGIF